MVVTISPYHGLVHICLYVFFDNASSDIGVLRHGVPQGSILGPLLFIVFIKNLSFAIQLSKFYQYADDLTLCVSGTNILDIQSNLSADLRHIESWCLNNRLIINISKSKCMVICTRQKRISLLCDTLVLKVNNNLLENVDTQKVLGLIIDKNLSWKSHIDTLCLEISKLLGLMCRNKHFLPFNCRHLFYNSYILPRLDYCLPIWGKSSAIHLGKILLLQKRAIRIIFNVSFDTPTPGLFKQLGSLNIYGRCSYQICLTVFLILNSHNSSLTNLVTLHNPAHIYTVGSSNDNLIN